MLFLLPQYCAETPPEAHTNRLIDFASPYLLQHAHNPVDWYPWGEEAIAKAKEDNKLIFLSIGYSTCYWCHVAERTIYSNPATAALIRSSGSSTSRWTAKSAPISTRPICSRGRL